MAIINPWNSLDQAVLFCISNWMLSWKAFRPIFESLFKTDALEFLRVCIFIIHIWMLRLRWAFRSRFYLIQSCLNGLNVFLYFNIERIWVYYVWWMTIYKCNINCSRKILVFAILSVRNDCWSIDKIVPWKKLSVSSEHGQRCLPTILFC